MSKNRDALKFFQNFIYEMIDIGGINLPKSISSSLGAKLGKLIKNRGNGSLEESLKKIYNALNAKTRIKTIDENTLDISLKYKNSFCPVGGKYNPNRTDVIQKTICLPYTIAILNSSHPEYRYEAIVEECILNTNNRFCKFQLIKKEK
jgi:hypothetical protein